MHSVIGALIGLVVVITGVVYLIKRKDPQEVFPVEQKKNVDGQGNPKA